MRQRFQIAGTLLLSASLLSGQPRARSGADPESRPFKSQSTSSISYTGGKEGDRTVEITNVTFDTSGDSVPGRPNGSHLVLRTTVKSKLVVGDEGIDSAVTVEAWPLGTDLQQKPLYSVSVPGVGAHKQDIGVFVVDRTLAEVSWWSVYKLGTGEHLFDTYVDLLSFLQSREGGRDRYAGLQVPEDDNSDPRLKEPHTVAVVTYASEEKVIREVFITCADANRAALLRSLADTTRTMTMVDRPTGRELRIVFEQNYPSQPNPTIVTIPIVKDDLDPTRAQLPQGLRAVVWKR